MATTVFTVDALDLKSTKVPSRGGGGDKKTRGIGSRNAHKKGVQTTFAKEADYDVERRVKARAKANRDSAESVRRVRRRRRKDEERDDDIRWCDYCRTPKRGGD